LQGAAQIDYDHYAHIIEGNLNVILAYLQITPPIRAPLERVHKVVIQQFGSVNVAPPTF